MMRVQYTLSSPDNPLNVTGIGLMIMTVVELVELMHPVRAIILLA